MVGDPREQPVVRFSPCQCHLLSFEGPDGYARAGGIASRITGLANALAQRGFDTHLWFVGDPDLPGEESRGRLTLHRWCQWISRYHPAGVYDGEWGKVNDYAASLPPYLVSMVLTRHLLALNARAVVLAEEWHTAPAVLHLHDLLRRAGIRERVSIFWNANNTFGLEHIDWARLGRAATITTVSRYMRYRMWSHGVDPLVIPNGLSPEAYAASDPRTLEAFRDHTTDRVVLAKVARWDPDKRWLLAMDIVRLLKERGARPLLLARGGVEAHGADVLRHAARLGLRITERVLEPDRADSVLGAVQDTSEWDVVNLRSTLGPTARRVVFEGASAVLANSGHEPFGLVGLEAMAAGGIACTGGTGEDYVVPGWNSLVVQTGNPWEFVDQYLTLQYQPQMERALRKRGRWTAQRYAWGAVVERHFLRHAPVLPSRGSAEDQPDGSWRRRVPSRQPQPGGSDVRCTFCGGSHDRSTHRPASGTTESGSPQPS
jgi:glycosyltransferase involved in cell wall biosynthesis